MRDSLIQQYQTAFSLAVQFHDGSVDGAGEPYLNHLTTVSDSASRTDLSALGSDDSWRRRIVGILHDIIEDTDCTPDVLRENNIDEDIIQSVVAITHTKGESYADFVVRVSKDNIAKSVKIADLEHNLDVRRLKEMSDYVLTRIRKYWASRRFLLCEISEDEFRSILSNNKIKTGK